jgi:hypothetical protein
MKVALRVASLLVAFAGVGWVTAHAVMAHAASGGPMHPEVRLAGMMAGLFAGGAAVVVVGIAMVWLRKGQAE